MKAKKIKFVFIYFLYCLSLSCATLGLGGRSKISDADYSLELLRNESVESYVNRVAHTLSQHESPEKIGFSKIYVDIRKTSRIQGRSSFSSPEIEITRGMLNVLSNEAELACLLGHELGHKVLKHGQKQFKQGHSIKDILIPEDIAKAKWSQRREEEADEYGAALCHKAGYNPHACLAFFERLAHFERDDWLATLDELTATHKDFRNRATHLRQFLEHSGVTSDKGTLKRPEYVRSLAALRAIHSGDAVNELLPGGVHPASQKLDSIEQELKEHLRSKQPLPPARFLKIMEELSEIIQRYGISNLKIQNKMNQIGQETNLRPSPFSFMKEVLSQDSPIWDNDALRQKINEILTQLGRLGVGFIPVVGDAVDLYEFLAGKEFGTNYKLSINERVITVAGLLAGSGKMWREAAQGMEQTLKDAKLVNRVGRRAVVDSSHALRQAKEIVDEVKTSKKKIQCL